MKVSKRDRAEFTDRLRELVKPGDRLLTSLLHVSRSGMLRVVRVYVVRDGELVNLSYWAAAVCGFGWDDRRCGVRIGGCGMDVGFELVYNLSYFLFKDGFKCLKGADGGRCPSNDHSNGVNAEHHKDGGYALRQSWI